MDVLLDAMRTANLVFAALATGGAVYEAVLVLPTARARPTADAFALLRTLHFHPARPAYRFLPVAGIGSGVTALVILLLWNEQSQSAAVLTALALVLFFGALGLNLAYWSLGAHRLYEPDAAPDEDVLRRLGTRNVGRAAFYGTGFVLFALAAAIG